MKVLLNDKFLNNNLGDSNDQFLWVKNLTIISTKIVIFDIFLKSYQSHY